MLVSVTERTREIGIRLAIGAHGRHILMQFLVEAVLLSVLGGLLGIGSGALAAHLVDLYAGFPVVLSRTAVLVAFSIAALVGIGFGFFPALKASRLDPIEALRHE